MNAKILLIILGCSMTLIYKSLPRGVRNNNPLNIRHSNSHWDGLAPTQFDKSFDTFINPVFGFRAAARIISGAYYKRGVITLQQVINTWAPASDNNPTRQY